MKVEYTTPYAIFYIIPKRYYEIFAIIDDLNLNKSMVKEILLALNIMPNVVQPCETFSDKQIADIFEENIIVREEDNGCFTRERFMTLLTRKDKTNTTLKLKQVKRNLMYALEVMNCEIFDDLDNEQLVEQFDHFLNESSMLWDEIKIDEDIQITEE